MSKQPSTVQTSSNSVQNVDPWITAAQQGYNQSAYGTYSPFYNSDPNYRVAGFNADQTAGFDLARQYAQDAFSRPSPTAPAVGDLKQDPAYYFAAHYDPTSATAAQVGATDYQQFMNPFTQSVIDPAVAQMRQSHDATSAQIGAQSAAAGSFGGSREALRQAQNDRALGEQVASTVPQLLSQAYTQAQGLAQGNTQLQQQAALQNASAANSAGAWNAQSTNQSNAANQAAANNWQQYLAQYGLQAPQIAGNLATAEDARRLQAIQAILGIGATEQNQLQNILNIPTSSLAAYGQTIPQQYNSTTNTVGTAPNTAPSLGQQLLGGGLSLLGLKTAGGGSVGASLLGGMGLLCDARLKKDAVPLGKDGIGRQLFAFRYKWQGDGDPYTIGPMAQLEEQRDPDSVTEVFGVKFVKVH